MPARAILSRIHRAELLVRSDTLPEGPNWAYELDGYRALAIKSYGVAHLRSRNNKCFDSKYPAIVQAPTRLPDETVIDAEVVALDETGRPSFNALQNGSATAQLCYYVFDVLVLACRNVVAEPLSARRELLRLQVLPRLVDPIREAPRLDATLSDLIRAVREQGLEGIIAKRLDSAYEPGQRSGAWRKMRVNRSEEFVIGGVHCRRPELRCADLRILGKVNGCCMLRGRGAASRRPCGSSCTSGSGASIETSECPFANLPEARAGRWGDEGKRSQDDR